MDDATTQLRRVDPYQQPQQQYQPQPQSPQQYQAQPQSPQQYQQPPQYQEPYAPQYPQQDYGRQGGQYPYNQGN